MSEIIVKKVNFLVPVEITYTIDGRLEKLTGRLDYANQDLHIDGYLGKKLKEKVFEYLKIASIVPDEHGLSEEEMQKVAEVQQQQENLMKENV